MQSAEQILNRLITEKDKKENLILTMEQYQEILGQKIIVRSHLGDDVWHYHTHKFYEINFVSRGSCINLVEEEPIMMSEGELILINPGAYHLPYCSKDSLIMNFLFDAEWFKEHFAGLFEDNNVFGKFMSSEKKEDYYRYVLLKKEEIGVSEKAERLIETAGRSEKKRYILMEAAALEFMSELIYGNCTLSLSKTQGKNSQIGRELIKYMTDNFADVTLEKVAAYAGYSKTHICRIFKETIGKSFSDILADIRISRAKYSILNRNMSIKDIALKCGYDSVEYFQRLFKKKTGMTPGQYRRKNSV